MSTNATVQIVWDGCDNYVIAEHFAGAETPEWPIQSPDGSWKHSEDFGGQVVVYRPDGVYFGFLAEEIPARDVQHDEDGELILGDAYHLSNRCGVLLIDGRFFRAI